VTGDKKDVLAIARRVVELATGSGASEAEALVSEERAQLTRFANSEIHQNVAETNGTINLRVAIGKRVGVASSNRTDDEGLRRLAETAVAIARNSAELEDWGGLP
jgi:predicted Zn-dependent protease